MLFRSNLAQVWWNVTTCSVSRYGEHSSPFCVSLLSGDLRGDREFSHRIQRAVERASLDIPSGASSDDEEDVACGDTSRSSCSSSNPSVSLCLPPSAPLSRPEHKTIPTVSNPNSIYQVRINLYSDTRDCF